MSLETQVNPNTYQLSAQQAGDLSKATGSAKLVMAGSTLLAIGTALDATIVGSIAGVIVQAVGLAVTLFGKLFGNKWHYSTQVRWLLQKYQYHVLGQANVTSNNQVTEKLLQEAYQWYTAVLGVPLYDQKRLHYLRGTWEKNGDKFQPLWTYEKRAIEYLAFPEAAAAGVTFDQALAAAKIADLFEDGTLGPDKAVPPGTWADFPVAWTYYQQLSPEILKQLLDNDVTNDIILQKNPSSLNGLLNKFKGLTRSMQAVVVGLIVLILYFLFFKSKKSRK